VYAGSDNFQIIENLSSGTVDETPGVPEPPVEPPVDTSSAFSLLRSTSGSAVIMAVTTLLSTAAIGLQLHLQ